MKHHNLYTLLAASLLCPLAGMAQGDLFPVNPAHNTSTPFGSQLPDWAKLMENKGAMPLNGFSIESLLETSDPMKVKPAEAKNVQISYADGVVHLTWDVVTKDDDGDAIEDFTNFKYRVNFVKGQLGSNATSILGNYWITDYQTNYYDLAIEYPEDGDMHRYIGFVRPYISSSAAEDESDSETLWLGHVNTPWSCDMTSTSYIPWKAFDVNGDKKTWYTVGNSYGLYCLNNTTKAKDDWLIGAPMYLHKGYYYTLTLDAATQSTAYPQPFTLAIGKEWDPAAMTTVLGDFTTSAYYRSTYDTYTVDFTPEEDGLYYFGVHATGAANTCYLYIKNFTIDAGLSPLAPAPPTNLVITPDQEGGLSASIAFNAPSVAVDESPLTSLDKVEVYMDKELVHTFDTGVTPGCELSCDIEDTKTEGYHDFEIYGYNSEGQGVPAIQHRYIGIPVPGAPATAQFTSSLENYGEMTVTWDQVTLDKDGYAMNPALVKYTLMNPSTGTVYATELTETEATIKPINKGDQQFIEIKVIPYTSTGEGEGTFTDFDPCGTPYTLPFEEEWSGSKYNWGVKWDNSAYSIGSAASFQVPDPPTASSTVFNIYGTSVGVSTTVRSGFINIPEDVVNPTLSFWHISYGAEDKNELHVIVNGEDFWQTTFEEEEAGWHFKTVDMSAYKGKTVQLDFKGVIMAYTFILLDDIRLSELRDKDMAVLSIEGPTMVKADTENDFYIFLENAGKETATGWKLSVTTDGELYGSVEGPDMTMYRKGLFSLTNTINMAQGPRFFNAEITWNQDENLANNTLAIPFRVEVAQPATPAPELEGEVAEDGGSAKFNWNEPQPEDAEYANRHVEETFEDLTPFEQFYPGYWTTVDGDNEVISGISGVDLPNLEAGMSKAGFYVLDTDYLYRVCGFSYKALKARSGNKMMATMAPYTGAAANDWLISPTLSGKSQQISFYTKSLLVMNPEALRVLYSTEDSTDINDFTEVVFDLPNVPAGSWQYYTVDLPEGAKRFAFQSYSEKGFILMIDDVEFDTGEQYADNKVVGYNFYKDGVAMNSKPLEALETSDNSFKKGETHSYAVTAVYEKSGESGVSNLVTLTSPKTESGISDATVDGLTVKGGNNMICVSGVADELVTIVNAAGVVVASETNAADSRFYIVQPGVYVVNALGTAVKVVVK